MQITLIKRLKMLGAAQFPPHRIRVLARKEVRRAVSCRHKMIHPRVSLAVAMASLFASVGQSMAQEAANLGTVVVIGEKIEIESAARPAAVIDSEELSRRQAATLGDTLRGVAGVSATGFGTNASRPIIRGQDGDRIKLLQNSAPVSDASAMSFDHAVAVNPYALEQVEMLRGPTALLYSGGAVAGVVNLVDRRILRSRLDGAGGSVDLRVDGSNQYRQGALELESPVGGNWFMHLDAMTQKNGETRTPQFTDTAEEPVTGRRVRNSSATSTGLGFGLSKVSGTGHWGVSLDSSQSRYGIPKEIDTTIDMNRNRLAFAADQSVGGAAVERVRVRAGLTDYQHQELKTGAVSSTFKNQANDFRVEVMHQPAAGWKGLVGAQWEYSDFDVIAVSEDPLMPRTRSPKAALFMLEERKLGSGALRLGGRLEHAQVRADRTFSVVTYGSGSDVPGPAQGAINTAGAARSRSFMPMSVSLEFIQPLSSISNLGVSVSHAQRAPSNNELFGLGVHHASGLFEVGNPALTEEKGNHLEVTLNRVGERTRLKATAFYSRYVNYLTLVKRGAGETRFFHEHEPGQIESIPVYDYLGIGAESYGAELEYGLTYKAMNWTVSPKLVYDMVMGKRTSNDASIARLTPQRLTPSLEMTSGPWMVRGELQLVDKAKLGENETFQAPSYSLLNVMLQYREARHVWFVKGTNLTDRLAFNATTVNEVRPSVPLAGRALQAGVRVFF